MTDSYLPGPLIWTPSSMAFPLWKNFTGPESWPEKGAYTVAPSAQMTSTARCFPLPLRLQTSTSLIFTETSAQAQSCRGGLGSTWGESRNGLLGQKQCQQTGWRICKGVGEVVACKGGWPVRVGEKCLSSRSLNTDHRVTESVAVWRTSSPTLHSSRECSQR